MSTARTRQHGARIGLPLLVGLAAVIFSAVYLISDLVEVAQGGFTVFRLSLTYAGEAAIPLFVMGLYAVQRPGIGRLGFLGAVTYAYSYVFFTGTVVYALIAGTPNYTVLTKDFGAWMTVHGLIMLAGGLAFGLAVALAGVLPRLHRDGDRLADRAPEAAPGQCTWPIGTRPGPGTGNDGKGKPARWFRPIGEVRYGGAAHRCRRDRHGIRVPSVS
jgi:hypothetical protein